jgi:hypothetical protein
MVLLADQKRPFKSIACLFFKLKCNIMPDILCLLISRELKDARCIL